MNPRISVILSVYNGGKYIKEAVESILNQTFKDFEFIIIDDGSTDTTASVLDSFKDPRIIRLVNKNNIGLVQSLNKGLHVASGEFVARMDADDMSVSDRFEKQIDFLEKHPDVGVLGTAMQQVDAKGKILSVFQSPEKHDDILYRMLFDTALAHATVMMRKDVVMQAGGYDPKFIHVEDTELWSRLILKTKFANLPEALYIRRLHKNSIMNAHSQFQTEQSRIIRDCLFGSITNKKIISEGDIKKIINQKKHEQRFLGKFLRWIKNLLPAILRHRLRARFYHR